LLSCATAERAGRADDEVAEALDPDQESFGFQGLGRLWRRSAAPSPSLGRQDGDGGRWGTWAEGSVLYAAAQFGSQLDVFPRVSRFVG